MSTPTIELVWTASGPPVGAARRALRAALARAHAVPAWEEWKAGDPLMPRELRSDLAGPRVYVNGRLAWTSERGWSDEDGLAKAIVDFGAIDPIRRARDPIARRIRYVLLPSVGLTLLPKCPLCWLAYAGTVAAFGLTPLAARQAALAGLTAAVILSVVAVIWRAARIGEWAVLWPLAAGAALVVAGKVTAAPPAIAYLGLSAIVSATMWSAWPRSRIGDAVRWSMR